MTFAQRGAARGIVEQYVERRDLVPARGEEAAREGPADLAEADEGDAPRIDAHGANP